MLEIQMEQCMHLCYLIFLSLILSVWCINNDTIFYDEGRILSRKKRYLIFPEGSSFQVIVEIVVPLIGDLPIFRAGIIAAMAWELPSDPTIFLNKKKFGKLGQDPKPMMDEPMTPMLDHDNHDHDYAHDKSDWIANKNEHIFYTKPVYITKTIPIYNKPKPNYYSDNRFSYRLPYNSFKNNFSSGKQYSTLKLSPSHQYASRRKYDDWPNRNYRVTQNNNNVWHKKTDYSRMHPVYNQYHRRSRRDLFAKIEKILNSGQLDGRSCLLKAICEISNATNGIGSFVEEILKIIFKIRPYNDEDATKDIYDDAVNNNGKCSNTFPHCKFSIFSLFGEMQKIKASSEQEIEENKLLNETANQHI